MTANPNSPDDVRGWIEYIRRYLPEDAAQWDRLRNADSRLSGEHAGERAIERAVARLIGSGIPRT